MRRFVPWLILGLVAGCPSPRPTRPERTERAHRWVDAAGPHQGDGTQGSPYRLLRTALEDAARAPTTIYLATGLYQGPFEVPDGTRIEGGVAAVLHGDAEVVVRAGPGSELVNLAVQGGKVGLRVEGPTELRGVRFSGQRELAVSVARGSLQAEGCTFTASVSEGKGLVIVAGASARLIRCKVEGPYRRGVEASQGATLTVEEGRFEGPVIGVYGLSAQVTVSRSSFSGGRGPALFAAGGRMELRSVTVLGHEYGLQTGPGTELEVADFSSTRAERAGVALVGARGKLTDLVSVESGSYGGLQLLESKMLLERVWVHRPTASGILIRLGSATLTDVVISQVLAEPGPREQSTGGDGLELRGAEVTLSEVSVRGAEGTGVLASAQARVVVRGLTVEQVRWAGLVVEQGSRVTGSSVRISRVQGPAVAVVENATAILDAVWAEKNGEGLAFVECGEGAQLKLSRLRTDAVLARSPCIEVR